MKAREREMISSCCSHCLLFLIQQRTTLFLYFILLSIKVSNRKLSKPDLACNITIHHPSIHQFEGASSILRGQVYEYYPLQSSCCTVTVLFQPMLLRRSLRERLFFCVSIYFSAVSGEFIRPGV